MGYETKEGSVATCLQGIWITVIPDLDLPSQPWSKEKCQRWETIGSMAAWFIWVAPYTKIFEVLAVPKDLWSEHVHSLRFEGTV